MTSTPGSRSTAAVKNRDAYAGLHMPVVSPKPISVAPASANCSARLEDPAHRDLALVRAAERGGDHRAEGEVLGDDALAHHLDVGHGLLDRPVDVPLVVRLGRAHEERHFLEQVAHPECVVQTPAVRHQHHPGDVVRQVDAAEHLHAVGQLRDDIGPDEARDLDPFEARRGPGRRSAGSCPRSRSSPVRSGSRRGARPPGCAPAGSRPRCDCRQSRHDLLLREAPLEPLAVMRRRHRDQAAGPLRDGAPGQQRDAVLGDHGVDVDARGRDDPAARAWD